VVSETPIQNLQPFPFEKGKTPEGKDFIAPHRLWVSLAFSMMIMISFICLMNFLDPKKYIGWTPILILSKFVSSTTGLIAFWAGERYFADLIVFITDFPLFVFIVIIYWRAKSSAEQY